MWLSFLAARKLRYKRVSRTDTRPELVLGIVTTATAVRLFTLERLCTNLWLLRMLAWIFGIIPLTILHAVLWIVSTHTLVLGLVALAPVVLRPVLLSRVAHWRWWWRAVQGE